MRPFCPADGGQAKTSIASRGDGISTQPILLVGYSRRFAPLAQLLKEKLGKGPMAMTYRINAGLIPPESWIQDPDIGGAALSERSVIL